MFLHDAVTVLSNQGYEVSYLAGEDVNVNFYRGLEGADLVIFRVHSAIVEQEAALFTNELFYDKAHRTDADILRRVWYEEGGTEYFGISPGFIEQMDANFQTVILMGCDGLTGPALAEAFMEAGADTVVGWTGSVTSTHSDREILRLLRDLETVGDAVPDPLFGSVLEETRGEQ